MAKTILSPAVRLPGRAVPMSGRLCRCSTASRTPQASSGDAACGTDPAASTSIVPGPSLPGLAAVGAHAPAAPPSLRTAGTSGSGHTGRPLPGRVSVGMREAGLATAEYAIVTLAAVGFAALLVAVLSSSEIRGMLMSLITNALSFG
ncbi:DUF4244 domain-containing protein [Arthrobacter crusticola]|uniref:DUF4244 domain-containing protein n=1 Tax=Arthrobacter crusticola TaxID=2547960 RepID=UPI001FEC1799|nr:DUF4244 domain-containing protein [Arthrobacter crusticola]